MTVKVVTQDTLGQAFTAATSTQITTIKAALGTTGSSAGATIGAVTLPGSGLVNVVLAQLQVPTTGIVCVMGTAGFIPVGGSLNGTILVGGIAVNLMLSSNSKGSAGTSGVSAGTGEIIGSATHYVYAPSAGSGFNLGLNIVNPYVPVTAGQWLTFTGLVATQGSSTTNWQTVTSSVASTVAAVGNNFGYHYIG